jgi:hypothetical protein
MPACGFGFIWTRKPNMTRPPGDPKRRRETFAPSIVYLAKYYAGPNGALRALFEADGYEEIEPTYARWSRQKGSTSFDILVMERVKHAMLRVLHLHRECLEKEPSLLERFVSRELARQRSFLTDTVREVARRQELSARWDVELKAAFCDWDGESDFDNALSQHFETFVARIVREALGVTEVLNDQPALAGMILAVTNDWMEALAERLTRAADASDRLLMAGQDKVVLQFHQWSAACLFRPWARKVARNAMIDALRRSNSDALNRPSAMLHDDVAPDRPRSRMVLMGALDQVLNALNSSFEWMHDNGTLNGNRVEVCRMVLEAWRRGHDKDEDNSAQFPRKDKQRARERVEDAFREVYASADCSGVDEIVIDVLRRVFGSKECTRQITPHDVERLEKTGLLLKQQVREGRAQAPDWALALIIALLNLNALIAEDV